jgi:hypothetical protein
MSTYAEAKTDKVIIACEKAIENIEKIRKEKVERIQLERKKYLDKRAKVNFILRYFFYNEVKDWNHKIKLAKEFASNQFNTCILTLELARKTPNAGMLVAIGDFICYSDWYEK